MLILNLKEVILRKSQYNFDKKTARLHIIDGLIKAISIVDELIDTIKKSKNKADAKENIIAKYGFSEKQAEAILMLQLYRLSSTDITKLNEEQELLHQELAQLKEILTQESALKNVMIAELKEIKSKYGHPRKAVLKDEIEEIVIDKVSLVIKRRCYGCDF